MVKPVIVWTAKGEEYHIIGGEDYIKNGCYLIRLTATDRILEDWSVPIEDLSLGKLRGKLQSLLKAYREGPFERKFLQNKGTLTHQTRPPM
jgi:hypothetical protein